MDMDTLKYGQDEDLFYKQVYEIFGKTKTDVQEYVDMLRKWAESQPHFPEIPTVNGCMVCIVSNKFSVEKAKQKLDMYYTIRNLMPEVYATHPLSPEMVHHNKVVIMVPLPKLASNSQRVLYSYISPNYEPEDFNHELLLVQLTHVIEVLLQEDKCLHFQMIFDCAGAKFGHASRFSPMVLKKLSLCLEKVYANRVSAIHLVNFYPFLENLLNTLFRPLFPKKIRERMKAYRTSDVLLELYDKSILPKDVGGEEKSLEELREMMHRKYEEFKPRFDKIQFMKADESLRPSKLENDDILGYYGSFKQIGVD